MKQFPSNELKIGLSAARGTLLALLILLLNCGRQETVHEGSVLRMNNGAEPQSLDPHKCTGHPGIRVIGGLFEGLVLRNPEGGEVVPGLARSWEISEDGRTYTFHLRPSAWSDGTPLTAQDFVASWHRFLNPSTGAEYASLLNVVKNGEQIISGSLPSDSLGVEAPDDSTFVVELKSPTGYFLQLCAFEPLFPVPLHIIEKYQERWTSADHIVSNGPFLLKYWVPNKIMRMEKNPTYWDAASVNQNQVEVYPIDHSETAYKMFLNHELDWLFSIPPSKIDVVKRNPKFVNFTNYGVYYYSFNVNHPHLKNKDLRKALSFAVDRKKIVELVTKAGEKPATGFVPIIPSIPYQGPGIDLYQPEKARELFASLGYGPQSPPPVLELLYNNSESHKKIAEVVTQMWKDVLGVQTELKNMEWKIYLQKTKNLEHVICRSSWYADYQDPYSFLELGVSSNGNNRTGYHNPEYDQCITATQSLRNSEERFQKLAECESILMDDMPILPLYYYTGKELRNPKIKGASPNPMGMYSWKKVHLAP